MTNDDIGLSKSLVELTHRQARINTLEMAVRGFLCGGGLAVVAAALRLIPGVESRFLSPSVILFCPPALAALGALFGSLRGVDRLAVARALDRAAGSEDRFASAVQLQQYHRRERAKLVTNDALAAVAGVSPRSALPLRATRELRLAPVPIVLLIGLLWLGAGRPTEATVGSPDIAADKWSELHREFREQLDELPAPETANEHEIHRQMNKLANMLDQKPQVKEIFEEISRIRTDLQKQSKGAPGESLSMRQAARSLRSAAGLQSFAAQLRAGDYKAAADALDALAAKLKENGQNPSAEAFEAIAEDFDRMSKEVASNEELSQTCRQCSSAASSMNSKKLSNALSQCSKALRQNSNKLRESDRVCRSCNMLKDLQKKLNECKSCSACKDGKCGKCANCRNAAFMARNHKKGGRGAGWGTADKWHGEMREPPQGAHLPDVAEPKEGTGQQSKFSIVSNDEKAESALAHKDTYAEFIKKAEADLALESVPLAYREYVKKYFQSIGPRTDESEPSKDHNARPEQEDE
jgi:uncharacterized protein YukE